MNDLHKQLVEIALAWEKNFGNSPQITSAISEYDAAILIGLSPMEYSSAMQNSTAVQKGFDFKYKDKRYQVKANRPSGKKGSKVTLVPKAKNYDWDYLIWILYNAAYEIQEAWLWERGDYKIKFDAKKRLSPADYQLGQKLYP